MPVHAHEENGVLHITVDGSYTSDELRRVGADALDGAEAPMPVFLDLSRAAGLADRSSGEFRVTAAFFTERAAQMTRVAILAPDDLTYGLMRMGAAFAEAGGLRVKAFRVRAGALAWIHEPMERTAGNGPA